MAEVCIDNSVLHKINDNKYLLCARCAVCWWSRWAADPWPKSTINYLLKEEHCAMTPRLAQRTGALRARPGRRPDFPFTPLPAAPTTAISAVAADAERH